LDRLFGIINETSFHPMMDWCVSLISSQKSSGNMVL
jgi:hypothetical protein